MSDVLVSVILTTYNRCGILPRAVKSVLEGTYANFEIIIVDDASPDATAEYAATLCDSRIRYVRMPQNGGVLRARNRGLDEARGDIITLLDDDDELSPEALGTIVREFRRLEREGVEILWLDCIDVEANQVSGYMPAADMPVRFEDYLCGRMHGDFWLAFRKSAIADYRFDERLKAHESLLWLRIHRTHRAWYVPTVVCRKYRQHGGERLCDVNVRMRQLAHTTLAMSSFIGEFGPELAAAAPRIYGGKLAYLGLHQLAIGEFTAGRASILSSLRYRFSLKYLATYCASFFLGAAAMTSLIRKIELRAGSAA